MRQPLSTPTAIALGAALVVAISACESDRALAPAPADASAEALDPRLAAEYAEGLHVSLADALEQLAPALGEPAGSDIGGHLRDLSAAVRAGDVLRARGALHRANELLARVEATPDAGAIGLVLDYTMTLLTNR